MSRLTPLRTSPGSITIAAAIGVLILLFWASALSLLANLTGSDAAGNAYAQAYAALAIIILWALLALLGLIAWIKGDMPRLGAVATLLLIPASGVAAFGALELLMHPRLPPFLWPLITPALAPPLIVAFCFWALLPATHTYVPRRTAVSLLWGGVLMLCAAILPFQFVREVAQEKIVALDRKLAMEFATLPNDAPLWTITPFLQAPNQLLGSQALERIRHLSRRQSDAETMLARGDFPLRYLGQLDLDPTPALCEKARGLLSIRAEALMLKPEETKPYDVIAQGVSDSVAAISWLIDYNCPVAPEAEAWEAVAKSYTGGSYDVYSLAQLREPKRLGRALYEDPAHFEMLTPRAHLKAWLKFAEDKDLRNQALAGARKLDHRMADAIEMFKTDALGTAPLLEYLPALDLEPTRDMCLAALSAIHKDFVSIYRPKPDDPRSYQELVERLGRGEHFRALIWLVGHGCEAETELAEAESLIHAYQPSAESNLMLYRLQHSR